MARYQIDNKLRQAAFLGQIMQESARLYYVQEIASGAEYEGRKDLGNTQPGDGVKFKGRGLIQITGRANYEACSKALFGDTRLLDNPGLLEAPEYAAVSAGWFWDFKGLNALADAQEYKAITRRVNGGLTAYDERLAYTHKALGLLG
jgi:putative chitinase